jgi:hypothetical protein
VIFSRFCNRITSSTRLIVPNVPDNQSYKVREILKHSSGMTTALLVEKRIGRCVYLPHFGDATALVVQAIIRDVLPGLMPHLVEDPQFRWLSQTPYLMPSLARIRRDEEEATRVYDEAQHRLKEQWTAEWTSAQTPWNELLTSNGDVLKKPVRLALETFGVRVVDVDDYWKVREPQRQKEEDLWLGFGAEADPAIAGTVLAEVKSSRRGTASEDDYGAVIKYLNRRKSEFRNLDLTGMLIINHVYATEANLRPRAFTETMMSDAARDRVVLATTWDLFRLGQRFLAGATSASDIQGLLCKPGPLTIS